MVEAVALGLLLWVFWIFPGGLKDWKLSLELSLLSLGQCALWA